ncbi:MAG: Smr/MutS family protein [Thermodesulfobacteriota bacterium]
MKKTKKKALFNPALKDLKLRVEPRPGASPEDVVHSGPSEYQAGSLSEDSRVFIEAMAGVEPLPRRGNKACRAEPASPRPAHPPPDEERAAMEHLRGLVRGSVEMDISLTDEYMEGAVKGVGWKTMRRLKRGRFPVQDHMDLHGLTRREAQDRVREFLIESHKTGLRCVLIVHGRGLNSPSSFPVLKEQLPAWFNRGPVRKIVLAFATARPYDGGAGAVYVLLRRR